MIYCFIHYGQQTFTQKSLIKKVGGEGLAPMPIDGFYKSKNIIVNTKL